MAKGGKRKASAAPERSGINARWLPVAVGVVAVGVALALMLGRERQQFAQGSGTQCQSRFYPVPSVVGIPRVPADDFDIGNWDGCDPVIIEGALDRWPARRKWTKDYLAETYAKVRVQVVGMHNGKKDGLAMPLSLFAEHSNEGSVGSWAYLQDEEFLPAHPELYSDLEPWLLGEDYYQVLPSVLRPDNAFFLWGAPHSRSTLHVDPYNWTGSNAVIFGRKSWRLFPPGQDGRLNASLGECGFPLSCWQARSPIDAFAQPPLDDGNIALFEGVARAGDMLLIPSGWFHQAFNDAETLAVASQVWHDQNFETIWESIVGFPGNVDASRLHTRAAINNQQRVEALVRAIPQRVYQKAERHRAEKVKTTQAINS
tara:strand:+ start:194 stop:1306 length:1113 start_codon:yes stop_codon:yes gene_type:complete